MPMPRWARLLQTPLLGICAPERRCCRHNALMNASSCRHLVLRTHVLVALVAFRKVASADAIPPPEPLNCPPGTNLVHGHGGTHCVAVAPMNCPAGWRGVSGGQCVLDVCTQDASCRRTGTTCRDADVCVQEGMGYSYGAVYRGSDLGAPPRPQWMVSFIEGCSAKRTCSGTSKCVPKKVCLPAGVAGPAPRPANAGVAQLPGERPLGTPDAAATATPAEPATSNASVEPAPASSVSVATPDAGGPVVPGAAAPGGRAGCALGAQGSTVPQVLALLVAVAITFVRRKR
jgi:hypothetical protein